MDLGLVFVGGSEPLPSIAPAIVLVAAAPLFAALLGGLFHHAHASFGEYLVFALYFQSALLLVLIGFALLPIPDPADDSLKILYFVGYVGVAARRLWESSWLVAMLKALVSFVFYAIAIMLAFGGILLVQNLVR